MTTVYRLFDAEGNLLYVGCSLTPPARFRQHEAHGRSQKWWHDVASCTFEHFETRDAALAAESRAIAGESPRWNVYGDKKRSISRATQAKIDRATELRASGLKLREIAVEMGAPISTVHQWINDPDFSKLRARKAGYAGTCEDCGAPTTGTANGLAKIPRWCVDCGLRKGGAAKVWTKDAITTAVKAWAATYGEPPAVPDWSPQNSREMHDEKRAQRWIDADGAWPHFQTVVQTFGTWSAAIEAAGFTPRAAHGGAGNELRRRNLKAAA